MNRVHELKISNFTFRGNILSTTAFLTSTSYNTLSSFHAEHIFFQEEKVIGSNYFKIEDQNQKTTLTLYLHEIEIKKCDIKEHQMYSSMIFALTIPNLIVEIENLLIADESEIANSYVLNIFSFNPRLISFS